MSKKLIELVSNSKLRLWQEKIIYDALLHKFIDENNIDKAIEIVKRYSDEDELFNDCINSEDNLSQSLANASQI